MNAGLPGSGGSAMLAVTLVGPLAAAHAGSLPAWLGRGNGQSRHTEGVTYPAAMGFQRQTSGAQGRSASAPVRALSP
ncbi:MAG: hypothetical protein GX595_13670 [Lentisphaerae bacterium]|nr:hypothetical protein [Lentisphaerota bacterium]